MQVLNTICQRVEFTRHLASTFNSVKLEDNKLEMINKLEECFC